MLETNRSNNFTDALEMEGWKGYEYWSAQLEAREPLAEYQSGTVQRIEPNRSVIDQKDNYGEAFPF